jgi:hypothetical protein
MRGIGEPRDLRGFSDSDSLHELIGCPLEAEPKDIGTYRNSDRRREHVHKPRRRKIRDIGQGFERKIRSASKVFAKVFENAPNSRVNLYDSAITQKIFAHPAFHTLLTELRTKR